MSGKYHHESIKKSRKIKESLIIYSEQNKLSKSEIIEMKKGYEYMAKINLEYSQLGSECMLDDIGEYEAWICGV